VSRERASVDDSAFVVTLTGMETWNTGRAVGSGLVATSAVTGAMALARRAGVTQLEFPRIIATAIGRDGRSTRAAGWALFVLNGAFFPLMYRAAVRRLGRSGSVPTGAALGVLHGTVAALGAGLLAPLHPRSRAAGLTTRTRPRPAAGGLAALIAVHVLYGTVIGAFARRRA
jgi:hypothetical protein